LKGGKMSVQGAGEGCYAYSYTDPHRWLREYSSSS
jgi:hypothetical protein